MKRLLRTLVGIAAVFATATAAANACDVCAYSGGTVVGSIDSLVGGSALSISSAGTSTHLASPPPFNIIINPGASLAGNAAALAAFERASAQWETFFFDPITVTIDAEMVNLGNTNTIGRTQSVFLQGGYDLIRNQMVTDASDEGTDDTIVSSIPTAAQATFVIPSGTSLSGNIAATKANLKAQGFTGLDVSFGASDGRIEFNTLFAFDFDRSDGIASGFYDFETVAVHEIGHLLGFVSVVDNINVGATSISPNPMDLFRFQNDVPGRDPSNTTEFTNFPRYLIPGGETPETAEAVFDEVAREWRLSTGTDTGFFPNIDQRQASHWKDNELTGTLIGVMDPTLGPQQIFDITVADLRVFDLIGYDLTTSAAAAAPEPATLALFGLGAAFAPVAAVRRRRRRSH